MSPFTRHLRTAAVIVVSYQALATLALHTAIANLEIPVVNSSRLSTHALTLLEATTPLKSKELALESNLIISNMLLNAEASSFSDILVNGAKAYRHMDGFLKGKWERLSAEERFELLMEELIILNRLQLMSNDEKIRALQISTYRDALADRHSAPPDDSRYLDAEAILTERQDGTLSGESDGGGNILAIRRLYAGVVSCEKGDDKGAPEIDYFREHYGKSKAEAVFFISRNWNAPLLAFVSQHTRSDKCVNSLKALIGHLLSDAKTFSSL